MAIPILRPRSAPSSIFQSVLSAAPSILGAFAQRRGRGQASIGAFQPNTQQVAFPAVVAGAVAISGTVATAIMRLAAATGIAVTAQNVGRVGIRLWRSFTSFAARHPSISAISLLASIGLTAQEAAEFLIWGQTKARRRRRRRGISASDIRITRRTMRTLQRMRTLVGAAAPVRRIGRRVGHGTIIAQN